MQTNTTYLQPCYIASDLRLLLREVEKGFPYKERRNKNLLNNLCAFFNHYNTLSIIQDGIGAAAYIGWKTLRRFLGKDYKLIMELLQEAEILYTDNKYIKPKSVVISLLEASKSKTTNAYHLATINAEIQALKDDKDYQSECRLYWINTDLLSSDWELFHVKVKKSLDKKIEAPTDNVSKYIASVLRKMHLPIDKAQKELYNYINKGSHLSDNRVTYNIKKRNFKAITVNKDDSLTTINNVARKYIEENFNGEFIKNSKTYYYIPLEEFQKIKTHNIEFSYMHSMLMLSENRIFSKREYQTITHLDGTVETRAIRAHNNGTNLPSIFRRHIRIYRRGMKNLDLKNSQFMFLTHAMTNTHLNNRISIFAKDYTFNSHKAKRFFKLTRKGILYDYIARELKITRSEAKQLCFLILFDEARDNETARIFKEMFGEIYDFLVDYKDMFGYAALAQELQFIEASVMIDDIYEKHIMPNKFLCIPIHDSFFCSVRDFDKMKEVVIARLNQIIGFGNYVATVEG